MEADHARQFLFSHSPYRIADCVALELDDGFAIRPNADARGVDAGGIFGDVKRVDHFTAKILNAYGELPATVSFQPKTSPRKST